MAGIGSGVGGYFAVANGSNNGTQYYAVGAQWQIPGESPPPRFIPVKSAPGTYDPHIIQGGPYVRQGAYMDYGAANLAIYLDAKLTVVTDVYTTGLALMLNQVFGGSQAGTQAGALSEYAAGGYTLSAAGQQGTQFPVPMQPQDGSWVDAEVRVQRVDGTAEYQQYHSGKITKAEFVFPRDNIVTSTYDLDFGYVALSGSPGVQEGSEPQNAVPFTMPNASSIFNVGSTAIDGCRKATVTFTPKLATDRIYIGQQYKEEPITNALIDVTVALEMDYTPTAQSDIFALFLPHTSLGTSSGAQTLAAGVQFLAVGSALASSGLNNTFGFNFPQLYIMSGGEAPLQGVDIIKNTIMLKATTDLWGNYGAYAILYTGDSTF